MAFAPRHARWLAATVVAGSILGAMVWRSGPAIALVVPTWVGVIALFALVRWLAPPDPEAYRRVLRWTLVGLFSHLAFGLLTTYGGDVLERYLRAPDASTYHSQAIAILLSWTEGFPGPDLPAGKEGYYYLLAGVYRLFGSERVAGLAVNAVLSAAIVPLLYDATRRIFGADAARPVPPLVVLLPNLVIFSSQLLKEAPILFLIAVLVNCATRLTERFSFASLVPLAGALSLLLTLRAWVALALMAGVLASLGLGRRDVIVGVGAGLSAATVIAAALAFGLGYSGYKAASKADLEQANDIRRDSAVGVGSGFDAEADVSTPVAAVTYLPRGLLVFMLGPFPWQFSAATQFVVIPDLVAWWFMLPSFVRGLRHGWSLISRRMLVLILPALAVSALLALSVGNLGTVVRERAQTLVLVLPIVALGWSMRERGTSAGSRAQDEAAVGV
jgi:hypothetical protein